MVRATVCLSFDFDAISAWLTGWSGGMDRPTAVDISRGEFGVRVGAPRVLELLKRYNIESTWFVPGHTVDTFPQICKRVHEEGHEVAYHGYAHEVNPTLDEERRIFDQVTASLKKTTGGNPVGHRFPGLDLTDRTIESLIQRGFLYDSSLMGDDFHPYRVRIGDKWSFNDPYIFGAETTLVEIPFSWYLDDWPAFTFSWEPFRYAFTSVETIYQYWKRQFDFMHKEVKDGVFTLCMHPQVIGRGHLITMLDDLIRHMKRKTNVRFCSLQKIALEYNKAHPFPHERNAIDSS